MKPEIRHYIQRLHPGFFSETSEEAIDHRDPAKVEFDKSSFGFRFFDRKAVFVTGDTLLGSKENYSPWYYEGVMITKEDIKKSGVEHADRIIQNMCYSTIGKVVFTKFCQYIPLSKNDIVLREAKNEL